MKKLFFVLTLVSFYSMSYPWGFSDLKSRARSGLDKVKSSIGYVGRKTHVTQAVDAATDDVKHKAEEGVAFAVNKLFGSDDSSGFNAHSGALTPDQEKAMIVRELAFQKQRVAEADATFGLKNKELNLAVSTSGIYGTGKIKVRSKTPIKVSYTEQGYPEVYQPYVHDKKLMLKYIIDPDAKVTTTAHFPDHFLLELPKNHMAFNPQKHFNQLVFLGSHDCQSNLAQGFLYYQQGESTLHQIIRGGSRMIRPNWMPPSGAYIDRPNQEPILCHAPDASKCKTVSLACRGFRPHQLVQSDNCMVTEFLKANPSEILIIGVANSLRTAEETDEVIEKIPGMSELVLTPADMLNEKNLDEWGAPWPTVDWMIKNNKRLVIFNSNHTTKYTFDYSKFVRMNMYGTVVLQDAAKPRYGNVKALEDSEPYSLAELSWFGDISPDPYLLDAIEAGIAFYNTMRNITSGIRTGVGAVLSIPLKILNEIGLHIHFFDQPMTFQSIGEGMEKMLGHISIIEVFPPFRDAVRGIQGKLDHFKKAANQMKAYVPKEQDNSIPTLMKLVQLSRKNGIFRPDQTLNNIMLDFATTQGNGLEFANMMNVLLDQYYGLGFEGLAGFALNGKKVELIDGILPTEKADNKKLVAQVKAQALAAASKAKEAQEKEEFDKKEASLYQAKPTTTDAHQTPVFGAQTSPSTTGSLAALYGNKKMGTLGHSLESLDEKIANAYQQYQQVEQESVKQASQKSEQVMQESIDQKDSSDDLNPEKNIELESSKKEFVQEETMSKNSVQKSIQRKRKEVKLDDGVDRASELKPQQSAKTSHTLVNGVYRKVKKA